MALIYLSRERDGHTLQPTALVNEAYLKLIDVKDHQWRDRGSMTEGPDEYGGIEAFR